MSSQVAENYQLKWHSHLTNLNSSVATLYRNEKFADVLLFTSNGEGGSGIPAHKLILSSCSHYFSSIFELNPSPPNAMIYIVLPPELSKRSVQILIQYMYSGEATVSNDILNEVLRGGEVLKIRGLWRNNQTSEPNASSTPQYHSNVKLPTTGNELPLKDNQMEKPIYDHHRSTTVDRLQQQTTTMPSLPLPAASALSNNKETSPVIVMSSQMQQQSQPPLTHMKNSSAGLLHNSSIKKENMINEPNESAAIPASHYGLVSLQIAAAVKKAQQTSDKIRLKSTENGTDLAVRRYSDELQQQQSKDVDSSTVQHQNRLREQEILRMADKRRISMAESQPPLPPASQSQQRRSEHHLEPGEKNRYTTSGKIVTVEKKLPETLQMPDALSFLSIKQEPIEWSEYDHENGIEKSQIEVTVKPELVYADEGSEDDEDNDHDEMIYSPLTCELCSETFTVPAEWVRHIEGHAEATQCVPKKRKRIDESTCENIAALRCDLCSMFFVTPAEWVRHVQNTHTETELAMSNNSTPPKRNQRPMRPIDGQPLEKSCSICKKTFPSFASMVIHKRTHTGERPFYCSLCNKGFNVKSNLLRHMRTLHNQLLNPSNINDYPEGGINPE